MFFLRHFLNPAQNPFIVKPETLRPPQYKYLTCLHDCPLLERLGNRNLAGSNTGLKYHLQDFVDLSKRPDYSRGLRLRQRMNIEPGQYCMHSVKGIPDREVFVHMP